MIDIASPPSLAACDSTLTVMLSWYSPTMVNGQATFSFRRRASSAFLDTDARASGDWFGSGKLGATHPGATRVYDRFYTWKVHGGCLSAVGEVERMGCWACSRA